MLSIGTDPTGEVVHLHADLVGLAELEALVARLRAQLQQEECEDAHLFSGSWGTGELSETLLESERESGWRQVQHLKLHAWTKEWACQHGLLGAA